MSIGSRSPRQMPSPTAFARYFSSSAVASVPSHTAGTGCHQRHSGAQGSPGLVRDGRAGADGLAAIALPDWVGASWPGRREDMCQSLVCPDSSQWISANSHLAGLSNYSAVSSRGTYARYSPRHLVPRPSTCEPATVCAISRMFGRGVPPGAAPAITGVQVGDRGAGGRCRSRAGG
jgi:hypothetical protein